MKAGYSKASRIFFTVADPLATHKSTALVQLPAPELSHPELARR